MSTPLNLREIDKRKIVRVDGRHHYVLITEAERDALVRAVRELGQGIDARNRCLPASGWLDSPEFLMSLGITDSEPPAPLEPADPAEAREP